MVGYILYGGIDEISNEQILCYGANEHLPPPEFKIKWDAFSLAQFPLPDLDLVPYDFEHHRRCDGSLLDCIHEPKVDDFVFYACPLQMLIDYYRNRSHVRKHVTRQLH